MVSYAEVEELFHSIAGQAGPRTVFGEPITAEGKTIVPVVKIRYGFGGRSGQRTEGRESGGGGFAGRPVGVIEITREQTRFIPIAPSNWEIAAAIGIGVCLGLLLGPKRVEVRVDKRSRD
jgi:uncharacterized spore protein YtfJ